MVVYVRVVCFCLFVLLLCAWFCVSVSLILHTALLTLFIDGYMIYFLGLGLFIVVCCCLWFGCLVCLFVVRLVGLCCWWASG